MTRITQGCFKISSQDRRALMTRILMSLRFEGSPCPCLSDMKFRETVNHVSVSRSADGHEKYQLLCFWPG